jgi:ATP-dependent protease ClpP protease subunit
MLAAQWDAKGKKRNIAGGWLKNESDDRKTVEASDNHLYYYADVESESCLELLRAVRQLDSKLQVEHSMRGMDDSAQTPIWLHIHSYGGSLFSGFAVADQLALIQSPLYTVIEGVCASAATLIALSGTKRLILPNSFVLIHQLSTIMWGTHEQFKDEMTLQSKAMERLILFYTQRSKLDADAIRHMLTHDTWLDAAQCVEFGFADQIQA